MNVKIRTYHPFIGQFTSSVHALHILNGTEIFRNLAVVAGEKEWTLTGVIVSNASLTVYKGEGHRQHF